MGIIINHYKDPYSTTSRMESKSGFFVAHLKLSLKDLNNIWYQLLPSDPFDGPQMKVTSPLERATGKNLEQVYSGLIWVAVFSSVTQTGFNYSVCILNCAGLNCG